MDSIVLDFLVMMHSDFDSQEKPSSMTLEGKLDYAGEKLIRFYGCYGCHNIPGFENEKPVGTELTEVGGKSADKFDYGLLNIEHSRHAWFTQKLKYPRSFDRNKVKSRYEKLRMPDFEFSDEETEALVTALLGFVNESYKEKPKTPQKQYVEEGQWIIREYNCQGCHIIEGDGWAIVPAVKEWLMNSRGISEEEARILTPAFSPPILTGEGKKVQTEWLFHYIRDPVIIRPWLKVRIFR